MNKEKAVILDIDGVILDSTIILKEIYSLGLKGDNMWAYFHEHCNSPRVTLMKNARSLLENLKDSTHVILSTARNDKCRRSTEERLRKEGFHYDFLYMRKDGDYRSSSEVKKDHLNQILQEFDVIAFIDDGLSNCQMAEREGIFALRKV